MDPMFLEMSITEIGGYGKKMFEEHALAASRDIFERRGGINPIAELMALVNPQTGKTKSGIHFSVVLAVGELMDLDKDAVSSLLRKMVSEFKADAYMFVSEAWMVTVPSSKRLADNPEEYPLPSEHPDRKEIVQLIFEYRDGKGNSAYYADITRPSKDEAVLGPWARFPGDGTFGRFAEMFPVPKEKLS